MTKYRKILVPVDGSATSARGLDEAIRMAQITQGQLRLVHVIDDLSFAMAMDAYAARPGDWLEGLRADGNQVLDAARAKAQQGTVQADGVLREMVSGAVYDQVLEEADRWGADLIVLGTHGRRGIGRALLGSSAENIVRHAKVPVLLVRAEEAQAVAADEPAGAVRISQPTGALRVE